MRQELIQYVELLFAGIPDSEEMKQEILQNSLDRYDDLISQGKSPESAYRLAISGIGDINELLGGNVPCPAQPVQPEETGIRKYFRPIAVGLYILCGIPLFLLADTGMENLGLCLTLVIAAIATVLIMLGRKTDAQYHEESIEETKETQRDIRKKRISIILDPLTLVIYLAISFLTGAWAITWVIFLISCCVEELILAIWDLKEAVDHEN